MNLVSLAIRNLQRRPVRSLLSILSIGIAVGSALALIAISHSIENSTRQGVEESGNDVIVTQRGASDLFGGYLPQALADQIAQVAGVLRVSTELFLFVPSERDRHVLTVGWPDDSYLWRNVPMREGRTPVPGDRRVAVLGDNVADALKKSIGDTIEMHGEKFEVIGITNYRSVVNRGIVHVLLPDLQEVTYRQRQVSMFHVNYDRNLPAAAFARFKADVESLGRVSVSTSTEVLQNDRNFAILKAVSLAVSLIALGMGVLNVLNSLLMATQERTREIGIVAAIGWSDAQIMTSIVVEGLVMCAAGCILGIVLSFLAALFFPLIPTIGSYLEFKPGLSLILPTIGAAFVLCTLGALYPAWRAVRLPPAVALRHV